MLKKQTQFIPLTKILLSVPNSAQYYTFLQMIPTFLEQKKSHSSPHNFKIFASCNTEKNAIYIIIVSTMFSLTGDLKYRVSSNFIAETHENGEEMTPEERKRPGRKSIIPDLLTVARSDRAQLEAKKKRADEEKGKTDESPNKSDSTSPSTKSSNSGGVWYSKLTTAQREEAKRKLQTTISSSKAKRTKRSKVIKKGQYVYTKDQRIAKKSLLPRPGGKRCYRIEARGTVIKPSAYYDKVWLIKFDDGRSFLCSEGLLHIISQTSPTHRLTRDENNNMIVEKIDREAEDREAILDTILNSKIHRTIGHDEVTYENLVTLFKPQYSWLTASKLRKHTSVRRRFLAINSTADPKPSSPNTRTWLSHLPTEDNEGSEKKESLEGNIADRNHENSKTANDEDMDDDDEVENHGLACTCCGVRSNVVNESDLKQMNINY